VVRHNPTTADGLAVFAGRGVNVRSWIAVSVIAALASVASCGGSDGAYSTGGGGGGDGGGGAAGAVTIGAGIQYVSGHNGTMNPAVDTIVAGSTVTWTWTGGLPHGVRSVGTPSFTSSPTHTGSGSYVATFTTPGTYRYDCSVHGQAMTGTIVVLPAASPPGGSAYDATATAEDPTGDTFGATAKWDVTGLTLAHEPGAVTVMLDFSRDVVPPTTGDASAVLAFVDLDLDQSVSTGSSAMADEYRQDGRSTALGVDARINLAAPDDEGRIAVTDGLGRETGRVEPIYAGKRIKVRVPVTMLADDDGYVNAAAIVGIAGEPSDIVPQAGHVALSPSNQNADRAQPSALIESLTSELDR
jgi:plastocyanin